MFVLGFTSHSRIFHPFWDVNITGGGLQILTYSNHSKQLSSEGYLACHTYCDGGGGEGHPYIMVISMTRTPVAEHLAVELSLPVFTTLVCRGWDSNTKHSACESNALTDCAMRETCSKKLNIYETMFQKSYFVRIMVLILEHNRLNVLN